MSLQKWLVLWVLLLDILGFGVLIPAYPNMVDWFHTKATLITLWLTIYSMCAFFATPLLGQLSDKLGRKWLLLMCVAGSAISFVVLLLSHNVWLYMLSRAINGITGGNLSILQAIMTDISKDHHERAKNFWLLWALFGLGFIIWPLLWGILLGFSLSWVFSMCLILSCIEFLLLFFAFKETHVGDATRHIHYNPFPIFNKYLLHGVKSWLFWSMLIVWVAWFAFQSIASVYLAATYNISWQMIGYIMAWIGLITAINQWLLLPKFWLKNWNTKQLMRLCLIAMVVGYLVMGLSNQFYLLIGFWFLLTPFSGLMQPVYGAEIMKHADKKYTWEITGFMGSLQSMTMFVWPLIGTLSLQLNVHVLFASSLLAFVAYLLAKQYYMRDTEEQHSF